MRIQETIREDGLRIISGRIPSKKVFMSLISLVGSAYDPPEKRGLYHYFEHMAFKGTETRTIKDMRYFTARYLLSHNASTGNLKTTYHGTAVTRKFSALCEFLCDNYFHSVYLEEEIEREKEVVLNEIGTRNDQDSNRAYFALWEALWRDNPLRHYGAGTQEGVQRITRADLIDAHGRWHVPASTLAIAIGDVHHDMLVKQLQTFIPSLIPYDIQDISWRTWDSEYHEPPAQQHVAIALPGRQKATIVCGCKIPVHNDERTRVVQSFLTYLLVRGNKSILWDEIREKRGFAYSVSGGISGEHALGHYFFANASVLPFRVDQVCDLMYQYITTPLADNRMFSNIKEWLYDWYTLGYEDLHDWANLFVSTVNRGLPVKRCERFFPHMLKLIESVTLDEVEALRASMLQRENFVTVIIRPE